jgi:hypothetical protein
MSHFYREHSGQYRFADRKHGLFFNPCSAVAAGEHTHSVFHGKHHIGFLHHGDHLAVIELYSDFHPVEFRQFPFSRMTGQRADGCAAERRKFPRPGAFQCLEKKPRFSQCLEATALRRAFRSDSLSGLWRKKRHR